ncbi:MAG: hypothetical protein H6555_03810 [Lewinellaceae bacterium]|nr:hypothetical protein [Lewinellaceae bacterium]
MGCQGCTVCGTSNGSVKGCQSNGGCSTGGCNRLNTYDWLSALDIADTDPFDVVEVSFKNGAHKGFFQVVENQRVFTGEMVVVDTGNGYDVGKVTLSGELVRLQMKKMRVRESAALNPVIRTANERDLERLQEARELDIPTMIRARAIARTLGLDMKIGDVEFQADRRKATFYYTADGRVDFRELIRHYAKEFRVKIEMRQIGARQESARIGGIGSCGRELCCSTWLTDFKSVSTSAARYQNLAINQAKLSGQCGRLKCCLNYELDTYIEAIENFPQRAERLDTQKGKAILIKTDIFKGLMFYVYEHDRGRGTIYPLTIPAVREIQEMNARGEKPADFTIVETVYLTEEESDKNLDFAVGTGEIELPEEQRRRKKKKKKKRRPEDQSRSNNNGGNAEPNRSGNANQRQESRPPRQENPPRNQEQPQQNRGNREKPEKEGRSSGPKKRRWNNKNKRSPRPGGDKPTDKRDNT